MLDNAFVQLIIFYVVCLTPFFIPALITKNVLPKYKIKQNSSGFRVYHRYPFIPIWFDTFDWNYSSNKNALSEIEKDIAQRKKKKDPEYKVEVIDGKAYLNGDNE